MARKKKGNVPLKAENGKGRQTPPDYSSAVVPALVLILMTLIVLFVQSHAVNGMV